MIRSKYLDNFVSRETSEKLDLFYNHLILNNKKLALISKNSEKFTYVRHFEDSAQIIDYFDDENKDILDIGTGAGFPGIILDIIKVDKNKKFNMNLLEKSPKKCKFLKEAIRLLDLDIKIHNADINMLRNKNYNVIVARAFKPLPVILDLVHSNFKYFKEVILFLGKNGKGILQRVLKEWSFEYDEKKSITNSESTILKITNLEKI